MKKNKKVLYCITLILSIFILVGSYKVFISNTKEPNLSDSEEVVYTDTKTLPDTYTPEMAKSKGDVVIVDTEIYNKQKLDKFISSIDKKNPDKVQIVVYTQEGDALIEQLYYNGKSIKLITDNTRDKVTLSEYREINTYEVVNIVKHIKEEGVLYVANLSNGEKFDIAYFKLNN